MEIYFNRIEEIRKEQGLSIAKMCKLMDITPMTFWHWKNGNIIPTESKVRRIANVLNTNIEKISDIKPAVNESSVELKDNIDSWFLLGGSDEGKRLKENNLLLELMKKQQEELRQASILIRAIMSSMDNICYIKDVNSKYLVANDAFLKLVSFTKKRVNNCDDFYFFPKNEANKNHQEDMEVIISGKPVIGNESILPGTRKKRWCMSFKHPIMDIEGKIAGLIGVFVDITEKMKIERINNLLKYAIDNGEDAFFLLNEETFKYYYISKSVEKIYGYPPEKFYNDFNFWINTCVHPDCKEQELNYRKNKNWPEKYLCRIIDSSGKIKWIEKRHYIGKGYYLKLERDITESLKNKNIMQKIIENLRRLNVSEDIINKAVNIDIDK